VSGDAAIPHFNSPRELLGREGMSLGPTPWLRIEQERIDRFAEATEDYQWIHVDVERARTGPFGGTIAHGYLTMSLAAYFLPQMLVVDNVAWGVNVGLDRLRFLAPVRAGARLRALGEIVKVEENKGGIQTVIRMTIEIEGGDKPACVLDMVTRSFPRDNGRNNA